MDLMAAKVRGVYENPAGSGVWWIQYFEGGRRRRERVGTRGNAIKLYQKRKTQILVGEKLPELQRRKVTLGELLDDVLAFTAQHKSARDYRVKAELVRAAMGTRSADSITSGEIEAWIRKREVSSATANRYRAFFSLCFRQAIRAGKLRENPAKMIAQRREPRGRYRFLARDEEYPRLLQRLESSYPERVKAFVFSVFSGARLSEQFHLAWRNVDFEREEMTFVDTKNGESRTVPMNSVVKRILEELRPKKVSSRGLVFGSLHRFCCTTAPTGSVVQQTGNSPKWFRDVAAELGVHDYTWHNNRHTFCSWLAMAGTPLKTIQELAGHKSIAITARYAHLSPDHKRGEIERLVAATGPKLVRKES